MESMRENDNNSDEEYTATQELPKGGNPFINSPEYKKWLEDHHLIEPRCAGYMDKGGWHDGESGKESGKMWLLTLMIFLMLMMLMIPTMT